MLGVGCLAKSLLLYFVAFFISCFFANGYQKRMIGIGKLKKVIYYFLILFPPTFLSAFRDGIGIDFPNYQILYQLSSFEGALTSKEPN